MPCSPSSPSFGQRSRGNWLLLSISAARGAISWLAKSCTVSRMASAVSPRSKLNIRCALGIIADDLSGKFLRFFRLKPYSLEISLSRPEKSPCGGIPAWPEPQGNSPLRGRAQRDVIRRKSAFPALASRKGQTGSSPMHGTLDLAQDPSREEARERAS